MKWNQWGLTIFLVLTLGFLLANFLAIPALADYANCKSGSCVCSCSGLTCSCDSGGGACLCSCEIGNEKFCDKEPNE